MNVCVMCACASVGILIVFVEHMHVACYKEDSVSLATIRLDPSDGNFR